jgi:polyphosphate kinase
MSETITVTSIVGRFLEHARIFHFRNGGNDEVLLGSADLMPRNLDNRVEVLFPITNRRLKRAIIEGILASHIADNQQARQLGPDGLYTCASHGIDEEHVNSQFRMMAHPWYHYL